MSVVMCLPMRVIVAIVGVSVRRSMRRIRTALGLKRRLLLGDDQMHRSQHVRQHMVRLDLEMIRRELDLHMAVAQVISRANQVKGRAVRTAPADVQHALRRRDDLHQRAVFTHQHIAAAHGRATWQEHADLATARIGAVKAAFLAHIPVKFNRHGALDQNRRQASALWHEFGGSNHGAYGI
jgi:hypothetical protein